MVVDINNDLSQSDKKEISVSCVCVCMCVLELMIILVFIDFNLCLIITLSKFQDNFMLSRKVQGENGLRPAMFIATVYDKASESWTGSSPSVLVRY